MRGSLKRGRSLRCAARRRGLSPRDQVLEAGREPPLGGHVVTPRHGYAHHGIYVGRGRVVQYGGLSRGLRRGPVEEVSLARFSHEHQIWLRIGDCGWSDRPEVVRRARSRLGEDRYHVLKNNCEHFCEWCVRGQHRSYQVDELLGRYSRTWQRIIELFARIVLGAGYHAAVPRHGRTIWHATEHTFTPPNEWLRDLAGGSTCDPPAFYFTRERVND
jgi:hypothetical protein